MNSFKTLVGGELTSYTEMMNEARAIATKRMCEDAEAMGADAVVNIHVLPALRARRGRGCGYGARQLELRNRHAPE